LENLSSVDKASIHRTDMKTVYYYCSRCTKARQARNNKQAKTS